MWSYLLIYVLVVLVVDFSGFTTGMPFVQKLIARYPTLTHPLVCSMCATWWTLLICVLFLSAPPWMLILPFFTRITNMAVNFVNDLFTSLFLLLSKVIRITK